MDGEIIDSSIITIRWIEPKPESLDNSLIAYEIFYCDNYDFILEPNWKKIAVVPSNTESYKWTIDNRLKGKNFRISIRGVNIRGQRSDFSISANSFEIKGKRPNPPNIISPISNSKHNRVINIIFDESEILNTYSEKSKYFLYYSSNNLNIPYTLLAQSIKTGIGALSWNVSDLPSSDDYKIYVYLMDDDGNKSSEIIIEDVSIMQEGYFLIDTIPPDIFIDINNSNEFTKNRDVFVNLYSYDKTTDVHSVKFIEEENNGDPEEYSMLKTWKLSENEGEKTLEVLVQDFGGNRSIELDNFRILKNYKNANIVDVKKDVQDKVDIIYIGLNFDNSSFVDKFSPNSSRIISFDSNIISIEIHNGFLYISVDNNEKTALVYKFLTEKDLAFSFNEQDSKITTLCSYKNDLYFGCLNGSFYKYSNNTITKIRLFEKSIKKIYSDNNILYILLNNYNNIIVFNGQEFKEINND